MNILKKMKSGWRTEDFGWGKYPNSKRVIKRWIKKRAYRSYYSDLFKE